MKKGRLMDDRAVKWTHRLGLGMGSLAGVFWLISVVGSLIDELLGEHTPFTLEGAALGGLVLLAVVGVLIAWRWEGICLLYTSPSPRDAHESRMPSSA